MWATRERRSKAQVVVKQSCREGERRSLSSRSRTFVSSMMPLQPTRRISKLQVVPRSYGGSSFTYGTPGKPGRQGRASPNAVRRLHHAVKLQLTGVMGRGRHGKELSGGTNKHPHRGSCADHRLRVPHLTSTRILHCPRSPAPLESPISKCDNDFFSAVG